MRRLERILSFLSEASDFEPEKGPRPQDSADLAHLFRVLLRAIDRTKSADLQAAGVDAIRGLGLDPSNRLKTANLSLSSPLQREQVEPLLYRLSAARGSGTLADTLDCLATLRKVLIEVLVDLPPALDIQA